MPFKSESSFTLIEVIAALLIIAVAFTAIAQAQGGSIRTVLRSEKLSQAIGLAQDLMTDLEIEVQKKNMAAFAEEETGKFDEEKLSEFRWVKQMEPVDLSCFVPTGDEASEQAGFVQLAEGIFEKAIRKAVIRVEWDEGTETRSAELSQLMVRFEEIPKL